MQKVFLNDLPFGITSRLYIKRYIFRCVCLYITHSSFKTKPPKCYSTQKKRKNLLHSPEFKTFIQTDINIPLVSFWFSSA